MIHVTYVIIQQILNHVTVPATLKLYEKLDVKHTPLKLISPQFEAPLPALQAAVSITSSFIFEEYFKHNLDHLP